MYHFDTNNIYSSMIIYWHDDVKMIYFLFKRWSDKFEIQGENEFDAEEEINSDEEDDTDSRFDLSNLLSFEEDDNVSSDTDDDEQAQRNQDRTARDGRPAREERATGADRPSGAEQQHHDHRAQLDDQAARDDEDDDDPNDDDYEVEDVNSIGVGTTSISTSSSGPLAKLMKTYASDTDEDVDEDQRLQQSDDQTSRAAVSDVSNSVNTVNDNASSNVRADCERKSRRSQRATSTRKRPTFNKKGKRGHRSASTRAKNDSLLSDVQNTTVEQSFNYILRSRKCL